MSSIFSSLYKSREVTKRLGNGYFLAVFFSILYLIIAGCSDLNKPVDDESPSTQEYILSFDGNGATDGNAPESVTVVEGENFILPVPGNLTKDGFAFDSWTIAGDPTEYLPGTIYTPSADTIFIAKWAEYWTASFDKGDTNDGEAPTSIKVAKGREFNLPVSDGMTKSGFVFDGWSIAGDTTQYAAETLYMPIADVTFIATWAKSWNVSYEKDGALGTMDPPSEATIAIKSGETLTLPNIGTLKKGGYIFDGWSDGTKKYGAGDETGSITADITFTAIWTKVFTVNYLKNGALGEMDPATAEFTVRTGETLTLPNIGTLKKGGHIFDGWSDGTNEYNAGEETGVITKDTTFTAIWDKVFISVWKTTSSGQVITLPLVQDGEYDFTVDWGDNSTDEITTAAASHTYVAAGTYTIHITGKIKGWSFTSVPASRHNIYEIKYWGPLDFGVTSGQFNECTNLKLTTPDAPILSDTKKLYTAFKKTALTSFPGAANWDVSNVTHMGAMFEGANAFNGDLAEWDVSNVQNMNSMFRSTVFNGDISGWDVSSVTDMSSMFKNNSAFNRDLPNWNVSNVRNMNAMFNTTEQFNGNIFNWDVSNVTNMSFMFSDAVRFNQDLSNPNDPGNPGWDVSNVKNMTYMFRAANAFNGNISGWDVSSVEGMDYMFIYAVAFKGDLSSWPVRPGVTHTRMFEGSGIANDGAKQPTFLP